MVAPRTWKWSGNPYKAITGKPGTLRRAWPLQIYNLINSGAIRTTDSKTNDGTGWIVCNEDVALVSVVDEVVEFKEDRQKLDGEGKPVLDEQEKPVMERVVIETILVTCTLTETDPNTLDGKVVHDQHDLNVKEQRLMDYGQKSWDDVDAVDKLMHVAEQKAIDDSKILM